MRELTIRTVQGIGDIWWVYQKLAPHVDRLHVKIACVANDEVQVRAEPFVRLLPKVGRVEMAMVGEDTYQHLARMKPRLPVITPMEEQDEDDPYDAYGADVPEIDYAVNGWLEDAVRIEDIDPGVAFERKVSMLGVPDEPPPCDDSLCVYMSGNKHCKAWDSTAWRRFIMAWWERERFSKVVFVGAQYDRWMAFDVRRKLKVPTESIVGEADLPASIAAIRRSKMFLEYQSGLGVIAENYGVRMIRLVFPELHKMLYTWSSAKKATRQYQEFLFSQSPEEVLHESL